jgi:heme-degrading monooxygenase HmoA
LIARVWSAQATQAQAPEYAEHLRAKVLPALRGVDGYAGAILLEREVSGAVEIVVLTFWRSLDSVRGFAGDDLEGAVVAEEAAALLTRFDQRVRHYEVAVKDGA